MNLFDLSGPTFLVVYGVLFMGAIILGRLLRDLMRLPSGDPGKASDLDAFEVACLAGGDRAAINTALGSLVHRGSLVPDTSTRQLVAGDSPPGDAHPIEKAVYQFVSGRKACKPGELHKLPMPHAMHKRLTGLGLLLEPGARRTAAAAGALLPAALLMIGLIKINVGMDRGKPVSILMVFCGMTVITALLFALVRPRRSRRGDRVLSGLRKENTALKSTAAVAPQTLPAPELAFALALFGSSVLMAGPLRDLRRTMGHDSGGFGSSCGSSCSSGGGGDGGGGGGGCGGCGGGGGGD